MEKLESKKPAFKEFSIRIPVGLDEVIQKDAETNQRKKNQQINFVLAEHYADRLTENISEAEQK